MNYYNEADELQVKQLFENFVDAGLHGRFEEALDLIDEPYIGIGMGEQGIVEGKKQAELVLRGGYLLPENERIEYKMSNLMVNFLNPDAAAVLGKVEVTNIPMNGTPRHSGLMQTIVARRNGDRWGIAFTHASPDVLTIESVEAYPIRFMDHTISLLKAGLQAETVLYAEVNLTQNVVQRLEYKKQGQLGKSKAGTLEEIVQCGLHGEVTASVEQEYFAFWNRLRLLGLYAEGVSNDHFDYPVKTRDGKMWLRSSVEMVRQTYSGDIMAVISYSSLDNQKQELEQFTHKAFHDALTGVLNREGFERRVEELLQDYDPQNNTALFMIDLDDFKQINDRLGHQMGDTVLRQVAEVLKQIFGSQNAVGRLGGDEFMVMLVGDVSFAFLEKKAEEILKSMNLCVGGNKKISVSVSVGVACGRARSTFEKLYRVADIALYTAKRAGKCRYHLINIDTNVEQSYSGMGADLLSLQTLLDYTDGNEKFQNKTPYEALLENIPGGVVVLEVNETGAKLTHCNGWFDSILNYSMEELAKLQYNNPFALVHPDDVPLVMGITEQVRNGLDSFNAVYRVRRKDGNYRHISMTATTTERRHGKVIMYGIDTDMEEVVKLRKEIEGEQNRLKALLAAIPGGIAIFEITDTLKVTQYGNWFYNFTGYESEEECEQARQGKQLFIVWPDDLVKTQAELRRVCEGVDKVFLKIRLKCKDGTPKWVDIHGSVIEREKNKVVLYVIYTEPEV